MQGTWINGSLDAAASITDLHLAVDDAGLYTDDRYSINGTINGTLTDDGVVAGQTISISYDGDSYADTTVTTDADGHFTWTPPAGYSYGEHYVLFMATG